jgi:hypothetical protein
MNTNDYAELYQSKGFFWNDCLAEFVAEFGGKELACQHVANGGIHTVRLCRLVWIGVGRALSRSRYVAEFLGEDTAPVGDCDNARVELFLSTSGRLIGLSDQQFLEWGDFGARWRSAIRDLLRGEEPKIIGVIGCKTMPLSV